MKIVLNGEEIQINDGSTLGQVLNREIYETGSIVAIIRPSKILREETRDFSIKTTKGEMVLHLNDSECASLFQEIFGHIAGKNIRWKTSKVIAIGSFPTSLPVDRSPCRYSKFDCFFALGGFDNRTSYLMVSREDHEGVYGTRAGLVGRITRGRHLLDHLEEGDRILSVDPVFVEKSEHDVIVTSDLDFRLEDGMMVESYVHVLLNRNSPVSAEHFLVLTERGVLPITETTFTYAACSTRMNVSLVPEDSAIRDADTVTVRHEGTGTGRIYFYKIRRQILPAHNLVGTIKKGRNLIRAVKAGSKITITTEPKRILTIGLTQSAGEEFLAKRGFKQVRTGDTSDDAIIVEQEPELTMEVISEKEVETFGIPPEKLHEIELYDTLSPKTAYYIRKMTGLDHKPIGTMKVHFTYEGLPMVTFEGNPREAADLVPEATFDAVSARGDLGVTNMSRPHRGLIGIRLQESDEFGPTGEERYGTNLAGKLVSDLDRLMHGIKDGDIVYFRERKGEKRKITRRRKKGN
ncbi:MAG: methanogenesis marker 3 protein [Methanomassiliicoccales archaeon]|jgi:putative methanogenesis marker protein 3|nr:methanogenesis marker 3 protein [Methanomassiliicoccales archaeon]